MQVLTYSLCFLAVCLCLLDGTVKSENDHYFLKAAKSVPRIGRRSRSQNVDDSFEKFFLKASKSVPRIGRRGPAMDKVQGEDSDYYQDWQDWVYPTNSNVNQRESNEQKEIPEYRFQSDKFM